MLVLIKPGCSRFCVITPWKSLKLSNVLYCLLVLMAERFLLMSSLSVSSFSWCCCPLPAGQVPLWRANPCPLNPCPICGGVLLGAPKPPLLQAEPDPTLQPPSCRASGPSLPSLWPPLISSGCLTSLLSRTPDGMWCLDEAWWVPNIRHHPCLPLGPCPEPCSHYPRPCPCMHQLVPLLGIICNVHTPLPLLQVTDRDLKQDRPQYRAWWSALVIAPQVNTSLFHLISPVWLPSHPDYNILI